MIIYRDRTTGRFVKKSAWKRSKAKGGKRYVRQSIKHKKKPPPPPPKGPVYEWLVTFTYEESGRQLDVIVTARDEEEAIAVAKKFLGNQPNAVNIVRAGFHGWKIRAARVPGARPNLEPGEAEYRSP